MYNGFGVTGINNPIFWAFYITNFVFWIGISHAGTLISAILRLVNAGWRRPVTRCAEVITAFALMIGALFPIIHLGRPWLFFWLMPYPSKPPDLAEFPLTAGLGLLRHHHLPHRQRPLSRPADDPRLRADPRSNHRPAEADLRRARARLAGDAEAVASSRVRDVDHGDRDHPGRPCRSTPSSRSTSRWPLCRCGTRRCSGRTSCGRGDLQRHRRSDHRDGGAAEVPSYRGVPPPGPTSRISASCC